MENLESTGFLERRIIMGNCEQIRVHEVDFHASV